MTTILNYYAPQLEWRNPDIEGLVQFLVTEKGFNEERVRRGAEKLAKGLGAKQQGRLDGFFTAKPKETATEDKAKGKGKGKASGKDAKAKDTKGTKRKVCAHLSFRCVCSHGCVPGG